MKPFALLFALCLGSSVAALDADAVTLKAHPDTSGWQPLFAADLSDADRPRTKDGQEIWTVLDGGVITASKDEAIWTKDKRQNFWIDLEFKTDPGANSGVVVYCSDKGKWIPNSVEIQILDDFAPKWKGDKNMKTKCGGLYGHAAPLVQSVKPAGEWNRMTVACKGKRISVMINGQLTTDADLSVWTADLKDEKGKLLNPDKTPIPPWLSRPWAELDTNGYIGFQGKHAGAAIFFRNLKYKAME